MAIAEMINRENFDQEYDIASIERQLVESRMVVVSVGSSASIHLLPNIARQYPELLWRNEIVLLDTSRKSQNIAIEVLTSAYASYYASHKRGNMMTPKTFREKVRQNAILLSSGKGAATQPEKGLEFYRNNKLYTLQRISATYKGANASGLIVLGCAGKGTATLITPYLLNDITKNPQLGLPLPLGFITMPFRFFDKYVKNAQKTLRVITEEMIPVFLIDYESAEAAFRYQQQMNKKKGYITMDMVYQIVVEGISKVLSTLIEALNYGQYCSPPIDWSDLEPLLNIRGRVGTITFSYHSRVEDLIKRWKNDLQSMLYLRTKVRPSIAHALTIVKTTLDLPLDVVAGINDYFDKVWKTGENHQMATLRRGDGVTITSFIYGFDPTQIIPPYTKTKSWLSSLMGGR